MQHLKRILVQLTPFLLLAVCSGLLSLSAFAQNAQYRLVNCDDPNADAFHSIQEAVDSVDWNTPVDIEVIGACRGRVEIGDGTFARNSVHIFAPEGQRASLRPGDAGLNKGTVVLIGGAHGIWIERLDISGGKNGVIVYDSSEVDFSDVTIENNTNVGVEAQGNSIVYFGSSRILNNGVYGVNASNQGSSTVYFAGALDLPSVVEGNGEFGVNVGVNGVVTFQGYSVVRNNGASSAAAVHGGIHAARQSTVLLQSTTSLGTVEVTGNAGPGILSEVNSTVTLYAANIHNNSQQGVRARTRSVLELASASTIASNGIADVTCDEWSLVTGDFTGLQKLDCKNIDVVKK